MSGGTGRLALDEIEERGSRFLHNRGRASARMDYEELVREKFPQVNHVRCFSGRNEKGAHTPGHIAVVIAGFGKNGEGTESRQITKKTLQKDMFISCPETSR